MSEGRLPKSERRKIIAARKVRRLAERGAEDAPRVTRRKRRQAVKS